MIALERNLCTDEVSSRTEKREVPRNRHLSVVGSRDDEVERASVRRKVLVSSRMSCDEPRRAHLLSVGALALRVGDGSDVRSESLGEEETKVTLVGIEVSVAKEGEGEIDKPGLRYR